MTRPSQQELWAETAELALRFGWSLDAVLDLEHDDRRRLLALSAPAHGPVVAGSAAGLAALGARG